MCSFRGGLVPDLSGSEHDVDIVLHGGRGHAGFLCEATETDAGVVTEDMEKLVPAPFPVTAGGLGATISSFHAPGYGCVVKGESDTHWPILPFRESGDVLRLVLGSDSINVYPGTSTWLSGVFLRLPWTLICRLLSGSVATPLRGYVNRQTTRVKCMRSLRTSIATFPVAECT